MLILEFNYIMNVPKDTEGNRIALHSKN